MQTLKCKDINSPEVLIALQGQTIFWHLSKLYNARSHFLLLEGTKLLVF